MTPIPLRIILVGAAAFCGFFFCVLTLGKLAIWYVPFNPDYLWPVFFWVSLVGGIVVGLIAGGIYGDSTEVKIETRKMEEEAHFQNQQDRLQEQYHLKELQERLDKSRQLPARDSTVVAVPQAGGCQCDYNQMPGDSCNCDGIIRRKEV